MFATLNLCLIQFNVAYCRHMVSDILIHISWGNGLFADGNKPLQRPKLALSIWHGHISMILLLSNLDFKELHFQISPENDRPPYAFVIYQAIRFV